MKQSSRSPLGYYTIGMAALFLAGFFLLVVFGAQSYRGTVNSQNVNNQNRALLSYFETCISSGDHGGNVYVEDSAYGQVLVIPDGSSGYGLRVYCHNGELLDEYAKLANDLTPDMDSVIAQTSVFQVEMPRENLLRITTDAGSMLVTLRSEGGNVIS